VCVRVRGSGLGYYGAGIYLSPDARTSLAYAGGCGKLLVCAVLMGRIYKCTNLMHGAPCTPGTSEPRSMPPTKHTLSTWLTTG
jgi:aprataxin and PNK-like factor